MKYDLYLDDLRMPVDSGYANNADWVIVRSYNEAIDYVKAHGMPAKISFDNDLGMDPTTNKPAKEGYDFAKWLCQYDAEHSEIPGMWQFKVHSANPVGRQNIEGFILSYMRFIRGE
jgi:hypothetical protein